MGLLFKTRGFTGTELERFRDYQRLSYEVLETTAQGLRPGDSEKDAAKKMRKAFHEIGAHNYFHVPVALFGDRTTYPGDFGGFDALATDRQLKTDDTVILDAAPIFNGYTVDTSLALQPNGDRKFVEMDLHLAPLREAILERINSGVAFQKIAWEVDDYIKSHGYANCHRKHLGAVLGHRVTRTRMRPGSMLSYKGLAAIEVAWFLGRSRMAGGWLRKLTPNWNHTNICRDILLPGLWAVEPHMATGHIGVKFEEIMVIDDSGARWLDDDLPHTRRWQVYQENAN